jgi:hypothetical protein
MSGGTRRSPRANEPRPAIESLRVGKQEGVNTQLLSIYLNDHLAGAIAGTELARRALHNNRQTPLAVGLQRIVEEIEEDRRSLESLMDRVGATRNPLKAVAAWTLEKAGRLKLNGSPFGYSPLSRVEELEALSVGVESKRALWSALRQVAGDGSDLELDLDDLIARAQSQRRRLERYRLEAVAQAFGT